MIVLAILVWFGHREGDRSEPLSNQAQAGIGSLASALSGLFVVGGALVSVPLLERRCRRKRELDEAVTANGSNALAFRRTR